MGTNPDDIPEEELPPELPELPDLPDDVSEHASDDESKDQEPEPEEEEEKKESFDAGPYFEWQPEMSLKDFQHPVIQDESIDLLAIALKDDKMIGQRFAIYGKIEKKEDGSSVWHVKYQPSLPASATPEDLKKAEAIFGKGKVVVAEKKLTGIVHDKTREIWIKETEEEIKRIQVEIGKAEDPVTKDVQIQLETKLNDTKNFLKFLLQTPEYETGLSATVTEHGLEFLNRGGMNRSLTKLLEIVQRAFYFDLNTTYNTKTNQFESNGRQFTMEYHLGRSALEEIVILLRGATTQSRLGLIVPSMSDPESCYTIADAEKNPDAGCYSFNYRMLWEKAIRHNKEGLAGVLLGTIYIAAGLKEEKAGEFWTKESDTEILCKTIDEAKKYNITLDLDKIPDMYADKIPGITALMFAARKNDIYMVMTLIENGASIFAEDNMDKGPLQYAKKDSDVAKYLAAVRDLNIAIGEGDVQSINKNLSLNLIDITRPINAQDTALTLAVVASPQVMQVVVDYLVENKLSLDTPVFEEKSTALQLAIELNKLEHIKILLRAGADPKLALEYEYKEFYKPGVTKLLEKWADPKEMKKGFDDFVNKIEQIYESFSTKDLLTEKNKILFKELHENISHAKEIVSTGNSLKIHDALKSLWEHANNIVATAVKEEKDVIKTPSTSLFEPSSFARDIQTLIEKVGKENDFVPASNKEKDYKPELPGSTFVS